MALQDIKEKELGGGGYDTRYILLYKCVWRLTDECQAIAVLVPHLEPEASVN